MICPAKRFLVLIAVGFLWAAPAVAAEYVIGEGSRLVYHVHHPMHDVTGISKEVSLVKPATYDPANPTDFSGLGELPIQSPWKSFDSGNDNRDSNTMRVVKASQYPTLTYVVEGFTSPTAISAGTVKGVVDGRMYIAGSKNPLTATVTIDASDPRRIRVTGETRLDMTRYGIERPSLLLIKADKWVRIEGELYFVPKDQ